VIPFGRLARIGVPQALTLCRLACGAGSIVAVARGDAYLAATMITLGAVTDGLDGAAARWLGAVTTFGIWFDYLSDYACYIVAPWCLARLLVPGMGLFGEMAFAVPLIAGAIRYARNGVVLGDAGPHVPELAGLGTVFFAFVPVTAVFLDVDPAASQWSAVVFVGMILVFSALMNAPIRFPKLTKFRGASPAVLILLAIEPFWMTRVIAGATLVIGVSYVILAARIARGAQTSQTSRTRAAI